MTGEPQLDLDAFRAAFGAWLDDHDDLVTRQRQCFSLELLDIATVQQEFQEALFTSGFVRHGWPVDLGGLGGDARHRAALYDELGRRRVPIPESYLTIETLIPMLSVHAPDLARAHLSNLLRGAERWCQGFSEPDAGSDLASLRTKAVRDGDDWIVDGHKIWTSQATVSQRCVVLLRTGTPESRHRGLSMMLVDHDAPGVEVREIRTMSGRDELGEVLFDGVRVAGDRLIGNDEIRAVIDHLLHQPVVAEQDVAQEAERLPVADRRIVFGAGDRELLQRDAAVHDLPGILPLLRADLNPDTSGCGPIRSPRQFSHRAERGGTSERP